MEQSRVTTPARITATCIECETPRRFYVADSTPEALLADYECDDCGNVVTLDLGGRGGP